MKTIWRNNITQVIEQRLRLQSTQRNLESQFHIYVPNVRYLKGIVDIYNSWDKPKRTQFIKLIGGGTNVKKTIAFMEEINGNYTDK